MGASVTGFTVAASRMVVIARSVWCVRNKARSGQLLGLGSVPTTAARAAACARWYSRSSIAGHKDTNFLLYQKHKT
jgi:hypothetical protein